MQCLGKCFDPRRIETFLHSLLLSVHFILTFSFATVLLSSALGRLLPLLLLLVLRFILHLINSSIPVRVQGSAFLAIFGTL